jgi:polyhydroxyalkanoate synthesis regulator phasin
MTKDDESRRTGRLGQAMPGYSALAEAFGAAIDGASRMTRTRAKQLAERLLNQAGIENVDLEEAASGASARINQLAEEIIAARRANQALLQRTVTTELEKSLGRLGLARADEVASLRAEIAELRRDLAGLMVAAAAAPARKSATNRSAAKKTAPNRAATVKSSAAKTAAPPLTPAKKAAAQRASKKTAATRTAAKKSAAKKSAATNTARKTAARKTAARKTTGSDA